MFIRSSRFPLLLVALLSLILMGVTAEAATITINTNQDANPPNASDGLCSLREAISNANDNAQTYQDCAAGTGDDTINFSISGPSTITLVSILPGIIDVAMGTLTINGIGQDITISGGNLVQIMIMLGSNLTLRHLTIANGNTTVSGAGIMVLGGTLTVADCIFSGNQSTTGNGGAIYNGSPGTIEISNSTFTNNNANFGGAIYNNYDALVDGVVTMTITDSTFATNSATSCGGAIYNQEAANVSGSTFSGNSADSGGGICTVSPLPDNPSSTTVTNSTFSGNTATTDGGGVVTSADDSDSIATTTLISSTLSGNSAGSGGGVSNELYGILNLQNTIVANSTSGGDCVNSTTGTVNGSGINLIEDGSCSVAGALSGDPMLGVLADNGGPTQTMALQTGSPAINAATQCPPPATDQRGVSRPQGASCDIGAFELVVAVAMNPIPTLNEWAMILMGLMFGGLIGWQWKQRGSSIQ